MLRVYAKLEDGTELEIKDIYSAVYNSEESVPADDFTVLFGYDKAVQNADRLSVYSRDRLVFTGQVDEIVNAQSSEGVTTRLTARSLAGFLLDNEAEPVTYYNPSASVIYDRYLKPYGIKLGECDGAPAYGYFQIDKGMTQWQVFENFCKNKFGKRAVISGDGTAYFDGIKSEDKILFASGGDIEYTSIKEKTHRYKLISDVYLKLGRFSGYDGVISNKSQACKNIKRVRYINAVSEKSTIQTADKIISSGNLDSYEITLECCGCYLGIIGAKAAVRDGFLGEKSDLTVCKIKYSLSSRGEYTTIGLRKEQL